MAAMLIDTDTLDFIRGMVAEGHTDLALHAIDILGKRSPKSEERMASSKQSWYLFLLTGRSFKDTLLTFTDCSRMIEELKTTGETRHDSKSYYLSTKGKSMLHKQALKTAIPF